MIIIWIQKYDVPYEDDCSKKEAPGLGKSKKNVSMNNYGYNIFSIIVIMCQEKNL